MGTREHVMTLLERSDEPLRPSEVATELLLGYERTKKAMQRLARAGELTVEDGRYSLALSSQLDNGHGDTTPTQGDTTPRKGHRVRIVERDAWEDPPRAPRFIERIRNGW